MLKYIAVDVDDSDCFKGHWRVAHGRRSNVHGSHNSYEMVEEDEVT